MLECAGCSFDVDGLQVKLDILESELNKKEIKNTVFMFSSALHDMSAVRFISSKYSSYCARVS